MKLVSIILLVVLTSGSGDQTVNRNCRTHNGETGICMSFLRCPPMKQLLIEAGRNQSLFSRFKEYNCQQGKLNYVCCAQERTSAYLLPTCSVSSTQTGLNKETHLPTQCGSKGVVDHIVGGELANVGDWPWMVALKGKSRGRSTWTCGGSLISDWYVVTAAHCVAPEGGIELEFVRLGETSFETNPDCQALGGCAPEPQDIRIECAIIHPLYSKGCNNCNDIALLRLSRRATLNRSVRPICLPINPNRDMGYSVSQFQGQLAWAAGWGTISGDPRRPTLPSTLFQVQLPIQDLPFCTFLKRTYSNSSSVLCAGEGKGKGTCRGDSGGPLTLTSTNGIKNFLVGITSKGPHICGADDTQGIYTSVHFYIPWIIANLEP